MRLATLVETVVFQATEATDGEYGLITVWIPARLRFVEDRGWLASWVCTAFAAIEMERLERDCRCYGSKGDERGRSCDKSN